MQEYYFLFGVAVVWIVFAVVQDLRTREIANWLNFSLIAVVLAYRAFYAVSASDYVFFVYGLAGVIGSVILAYVFYYGRIFAGGDAKLLMGLGGTIPHTMLVPFLFTGFVFIFLLFLFGAIWTLAFSAYLLRGHGMAFRKAFCKEFLEQKRLFYYAGGFTIVLLLVFIISHFFSLIWIAFLFLLLPLLFMYVRAIEHTIMIRNKKPSELQVGDWLVNDIKIGKRVIRKSIHGLLPEDIAALKRAKKKVLIKDGVPFTPAFLLAYLASIIVFVLGLRGSFF